MIQGADTADGQLAIAHFTKFTKFKGRDLKQDQGESEKATNRIGT